MSKTSKYRFFAHFMGVSALSIVLTTPAFAQNYHRKTNHSQRYMVNQSQRYAPPARHMMPRRGMHPRHHRSKYLRPQVPQFQQWVEYEPQYLLYPGDQLDIVVSSAPELSRTLTVGPDGRIVMPMTTPIMAAGKNFTQVQQALMAQLGKQLRDPRVAVTPRAYSPAQVFVGGAVGTQGTYTLPGPVGAIEVILMAGGFTPAAKSNKIAVLRRAPNGGMMMRTVNIGRGMKNIRRYDDILQLRRGDIIFVPTKTLAEIANWMQMFRDALPVQPNISYNLGNNGGNIDPVVMP